MISLAKLAVVQQVTGGIVGAVVGLAVPLSGSCFTGFAIPVSLWPVVAGLSAAILAAVVFGTYPATRAAHLNPVEALKYE